MLLTNEIVLKVPEMPLFAQKDRWALLALLALPASLVL
jgi:hypothetical protein